MSRFMQSFSLVFVIAVNAGQDYNPGACSGGLIADPERVSLYLSQGYESRSESKKTGRTPQ